MKFQNAHFQRKHKTFYTDILRLRQIFTELSKSANFLKFTTARTSLWARKIFCHLLKIWILRESIFVCLIRTIFTMTAQKPLLLNRKFLQNIFTFLNLMMIVLINTKCWNIVKSERNFAFLTKSNFSDMKMTVILKRLPIFLKCVCIRSNPGKRNLQPWWYRIQPQKAWIFVSKSHVHKCQTPCSAGTHSRRNFRLTGKIAYYSDNSKSFWGEHIDE